VDETNNNEQRPRASLRGKGREILLGQRSGARPPSDEENAKTPSQPPSPQRPGSVDASALSLTPEETEALLDFSPSAPAFEAEGISPTEESTPEAPFPAPDDALLDWMVGETVQAKRRPAAPVSSRDAALDWVERVDIGPAANVPVSATAQQRTEGALPLAEREPQQGAEGQRVLAYRARPEVEALIPQEPERWPGAQLSDSPEEIILAGGMAEQDAEAEGSVSGLAMPEEAVVEEPATTVLPDPFQPALKREPSRALFERTSPANRKMLDLLVDDDRIRKLAQQIEALQEELAQQVYAERNAADVYQKELLQASSLLLASRQNYDDARAIVYRIRTDMNRQRKIYADIMRYRPLLLNYYTGWGIALVVLFLLKALFTGVTDAVGVGVVSALYYPMLLGVGGALVSGYLTLERHTTKLRDFDPIHISWYLFNPLLGGVMGLLMFLIASIANEDLLQETATMPEYAITYLLCVVAGMNQNNVLRQLNDLLKRFGKDAAAK
jgi:hypothetical protein